MVKVKVLPPGKFGGLAGTNLPNTLFSKAMLLVTLVLVVNVTALLIRFPELGVPICIPVAPPLVPSITTVPVPGGSILMLALATLLLMVTLLNVILPVLPLPPEIPVSWLPFPMK